jgi:hypothetical protein
VAVEKFDGDEMLALILADFVDLVALLNTRRMLRPLFER